MQERLGFFCDEPYDRWWILTEGVDAGSIADEISALIDTAVIPFLDRHASDAGLLEAWQTGKAYGQTQIELFTTWLTEAAAAKPARS